MTVMDKNILSCSVFPNEVKFPSFPSINNDLNEESSIQV